MTNQCIISRSELEDIKSHGSLFSFDQSVKRLLKSKGMPVHIQVLIELDNDYIYEQSEDFETGNLVFRWKLI